MSKPCGKLLCAITSLALVLLAAGTLPAAARPRDDAMAGAYRCSAIGPSRLWLDCYYGAAQPARAALGLAPVPPAQARLVAEPPAGAPQDQDVRDTVIHEAARCDGEARVWLDCYYAAAQPMRQLLGLAPAPQHAAPAIAQTAPPQRDAAPPAGNWFLGSRKGLTEPMKAYRLGPDGRFTVMLASGDVWRQTEGDVRHPHWTRPAASYVVIISRGALGSTNLTVKGETGLYKVEPAPR